jgi:hypothetical protein
MKYEISTTVPTLYETRKEARYVVDALATDGKPFTDQHTFNIMQHTRGQYMIWVGLGGIGRQYEVGYVCAVTDAAPPPAPPLVYEQLKELTDLANTYAEDGAYRAALKKIEAAQKLLRAHVKRLTAMGM